MSDPASAKPVAVADLVAGRGALGVAGALADVVALTALVVGGSGLVGGAILRHLGRTAIGTYRSRPVPGLRHLDANDHRAARALLEETRASLVFFPAADANVDWCEEHPDESWERNVSPALAMIETCASVGARFVFFSSDYVFDGRAGPYVEDDVVAPLSVYGRQKCVVEEATVRGAGTVVRTTSVFGLERPPEKNFVLRTIARLRAKERIAAPSDQFSTPTWSDELAAAAAAVADLRGIWHVAGPDLVARDELARAVARAFDLDVSLVDAVPTAALRQRAARPLRGGLRAEKLSTHVGRSLLPLNESLKRLRVQLGRES